MTAATFSAPPRLLAALGEAEAALKGASDCDPTFLSPTDMAEALLAADPVVEAAQAQLLRLVAAGAAVADAAGHRDVAAWMAARTGSDRAPRARDLRLATALDHRWSALGEAVRRGEVARAQAEVIVRALDRLLADTDVDPEILARAEQHLVGLCADHPPRELEALARCVLETIAPDLHDDEERKRLEREERRAWAQSSLVSRRDGHGVTHVSIKVPDAIGSRLMTTLAAFTAPRRTPDDPRPAGEPVRPRDRLLGEAFCELVETLDPSRLPQHGGEATQILVTISLDSLLHGLGAADLLGPDGSMRISATEARRLACRAHLIPAVLDGAGEVLDQGRAQRLFTAVQRTALRARDRTCRADGCTIPAAWCEAHHLTPWSAQGRTDVRDGALLCSYHHHRIHDPAYRHERMASGDFRFHRRR